MEVRLLGPVELAGAGGAVALGGPKERAVLAFLALQAGKVVAEERLIEVLWGDEPPRTAARTVQAYVSRVRRALAVDDGPGELRLASSAAGYRLDLPPSGLDVDQVRVALDRAVELRRQGRPGDAMAVLVAAEARWRGPALAGLGAEPWVGAEAARLEELRLAVVEERIDAALAAGRPAGLVAELEALCRQHPTRERLHGLLMLTLYRAGRQADSLRIFRELRARLVEELGIDPSPALVELETQILRQDPALQSDLPAEGTGAAVAPAPAVAALREAGFVGREDELAALEETRLAVLGGRAQVVLLAGEPGIGKTALAAEHAHRAAALGDVVLYGRCDEEALAPFQPFVEALAALVRSLPADELRALLGPGAPDLALLLPDLARYLPEVEGIAPTGDESERYRIFEAVPAVLSTLSGRAPVLLVLDDLHWADRPTLHLLEHVIRRLSTARVVVLGTYRDTDLVRTHPMAEALAELRRSGLVRRILIRGLSAGDVLGLVAASSEADAATVRLSDELHRQSEGHPLFLREILRHLAETGGIELDATGTWRAVRRVEQLGIPEGVREVIGRRLTRLSQATNEVLRVGSVLGRQLRVDVLERLVDRPPDEVLGCLEEAEAAGVVAEEPDAVGRFAFTHALLRQALYAELSTTRRVRLHQRVGEAIEAIEGNGPGDHLAELAFHFSQSAVAGTAEQAIRYGRLAAEHARDRVAFEEAARHYANALEVAEDAEASSEERAALLLEVARCQWAGGNAAAARDACERIVALGLDDPRWIASVALTYDGAEATLSPANVAGLNRRGVELLERAIIALGQEDSELLARVLATLAAQLSTKDGTEDRRWELVERATAMARRLGDPATLATVLHHGSLARFTARTATDRVEWCTEAAAAAAAAGQDALRAFALVHQAFALAQLDDIDGMDDLLAEADAILTRRQPATWRCMATIVRAGRHLSAGEFDIAERLACEAYVMGQEGSDPNRLVELAGVVVTSKMFRGDVRELGFAFGTGLTTVLPLAAYRAVAGFAAAWCEGRDDDARELLTALVPELGEIVQDPFWLYYQHLTARVVWDLDHRPAAGELAKVLAPYADHNAGMATVGFGPVRLALGWLHAVTGDLDSAEDHLRRARAICARHGWIPPDVDAAAALAEVLWRQGGDEQLREAAVLTDEVIERSRRLGMVRVLDTATSLQAALAGEEATGPPAASRSTVGHRFRDRVIRSGRGLMAVWTRGLTDEELVRRFGGERTQRAIFRALVAAFRPERSYGFTGDIVFQLAAPDEVLDPEAVDWWTLEVRAEGARARRGPSATPAITMRLTFADFIRLGAGEVSSFDLVLNDRVELVGDVMLALRVPDLFGVIGQPA